VTEVAAARYAGTRVHRVEDGRLLTGAGTFVDDVTRPGMLHACFVRSPIARARIAGIDASEALALPGVHAVFVAADLNPDVREAWFTLTGPDMPDTPRPPLAEDEVRFVGDPVALVVADSRYIAEDAVELVVVDYEPRPALADYAAADGSDELVHPNFPGNIAGAFAGQAQEQVDEVFASAAHTVSETIFQQSYTAVPIETRGLVVEWSAGSGELTIWTATQAPHEVRAFCSRLLGLPEQRIRVVMRDTGGGFGQKVVPLREDMCLMLAARKVPAALKWIEDRRENLMAAGQARHEHGDAQVALDADGSILAMRLDYVEDVGAYPTPSPLTAGMAVGFLFPGPYRVPSATYSMKLVFSNTSGRTAYRGPWMFETLAREVLLDVAARRTGVDPVALRRRNLLRRDELPYANPNGMPYDHMSPAETFEHAMDLLDYDAFRTEQRNAREQGRYLGVGTASYVEPTTSAQGYYATEGATIRIEPSGKVNVYVAGGSTGNSLETTVVQLTADALGVELDDVATIQGDTAVTPFGAGTGGSRSGSMIAGAVAETAGILREKLVAMAAHRLEAAEDDIELAGSRAFVRGAPAAGVGVAELASLAYFQPHKLPPGIGAGLEASARYAATSPMIWANATHVCTCEVDVVTGAVTLLRYIVSEDCGPMINPNVVEGQIAGGTVQGIGGALMEQLAYDDDGNPLSTTFVDYLLPTTTEVPTIEYGHVETPSPGPGGYKGVGEGGAIGATPAVVNAVADALAPFGVDVTRLPVTPAAVVALLEDAAARG
jgi:carbon-monoxide dehydrogenase large subunit